MIVFRMRIPKILVFKKLENVLKHTPTSKSQNDCFIPPRLILIEIIIKN